MISLKLSVGLLRPPAGRGSRIAAAGRGEGEQRGRGEGPRLRRYFPEISFITHLIWRITIGALHILALGSRIVNKVLALLSVAALKLVSRSRNGASGTTKQNLHSNSHDRGSSRVLIP